MAQRRRKEKKRRKRDKKGKRENVQNNYLEPIAYIADFNSLLSYVSKKTR